MMYLLAIGAPVNNIKPSAWDAFSRPLMNFEGYQYISAADPLFVHQYSHAWFDFRNVRDKYADYFQNSAIATYAHKLDKAEARLDFSRPAIELERKVRAFDPWPVAEADVAGEKVRIWSAVALNPVPGPRSPVPGSFAASKHGIDIACGEGVLRILKLQRAGGRVISVADYLNARPELRQ